MSDQTNPPDVTPTDTTPTVPPEDAEPGYYCPACGRRAEYRKECVGTPLLPHAPVEVVSTDELDSEDPEDHTPAPASA